MGESVIAQTEDAGALERFTTTYVLGPCPMPMPSTPGPAAVTDQLARAVLAVHDQLPEGDRGSELGATSHPSWATYRLQPALMAER